MNPQEQFCPNIECSARGEIGKGNIVIHSQKERRYKCKVCGKTFSETTGTALYGIKKGSELFVRVVTLLAYGCPVQAIVMAFGLDERTVRDWLRRSGQHCQQVHDHLMETQAFDLGQVQADEIKVKTQHGTIWMALAMMVGPQFWLAGTVGAKRDKHLMRQLANDSRKWALLGVQDAFGTAHDILKELTLLELSPSSIHKASLMTGERILDQEEELKRHSQSLDRQLEQRRRADKPTRLYGSLDGFMVPLEDGWHEMKAGTWWTTHQRRDGSLAAQDITYYACYLPSSFPTWCGPGALSGRLTKPGN